MDYPQNHETMKIKNIIGLDSNRNSLHFIHVNSHIAISCTQPMNGPAQSGKLAKKLVKTINICVRKRTKEICTHK